MIPLGSVKKSAVVATYETDIFKESMCDKCDNLQYRPNDLCAPCEGYETTIKSWGRIKKGGKPFITVPCGNMKKVIGKLGLEDLRVVDQRKEYPFEHSIKFTGTLYSGETVNGNKTADQVKIVSQWMKKGTGMIEAPPRSGKSVIGVKIVCDLKQKTLIIANQSDLLQNFNKTLVGDPDTGLKAMTNIPRLRRKSNKPIVAIVDSLQECLDDDLDIAMITYQKFLQDSGKALIKEFNKKYSVIVVDEAHGIGADCYAGFISSMTMKHRLALSATPDRKDGRSVLMFDHMGPIVAKSTTTAMLPKIELWETGIAAPGGRKFAHWAHFINYISMNEPRNRMIVKQVFADLRDGHQTIIIPVSTKAHMNELVRLINRQAKLNRMKRGEKWGKEVATEFEAKTKDRKMKLADIENGKHRVIVAIYSLMKQGIDLKTPSVIYVSTPTSNPAMYYQLSNRICTPAMNKRQPIVRHMVDDFGQSVGCFKALFWKEISPKLRATDSNTQRYMMDPHVRERAIEISRGRSYTPIKTKILSEKKKKKANSTGSRFGAEKTSSKPVKSRKPSAKKAVSKKKRSGGFGGVTIR